MPPAIAITLWTICMSMSAVVAPGFDCDPPSSAASRAPWRTADPEVTLSETMMLASKPPISSKASSGTTSASSTRDWPRVFPMSVALRLQPDVVADAAPQRAQRRQEAGLPAIREVDGDTQEITGAVTRVARRRHPGLERHRRAVDPVPVEQDGIGRQVSVRVLIEFVDVDLVHREDAGGADVFANYPDRLVIGRGRVAELRGHPGALDGCIAGGSDAEHQEAAVQHAQHEHEQDGEDNRELGHRLAVAAFPSLPPHYGNHYAPHRQER